MIGAAGVEAYRQAVADMGVIIEEDAIESILKQKTFDFIFFEFYVAARRHLHKVRFWQPDARIIVDTVDVHFRRLFSQASVTGNRADFAKARRMKKREISTYKAADILLTVTEDDRTELLKQDGSWRVKIVPNIHEIQPLCESSFGTNSLIFIGGFSHIPNTDAVLYFCKDILPLLNKRFPDIKVTIVGSSPPPQIVELSSDQINVVGFVPDTKPYLLSSSISIAPLRFGAGMKGKIGEAMAHGVPVVTTSVGIEGFGLTPGENVLVGNSPAEFAAAVSRLMEDRASYENVRRNGWQFIKSRYSYEVVNTVIHEMLESVKDCSVKRIGMLQWFRMVLSSAKININVTKRRAGDLQKVHKAGGGISDFDSV
jgi:glycosyltransferase involved in cell wall biosynthesis